MAVQFFNGQGHKGHAPLSPDLMKKAARASLSYDWTDDPAEFKKLIGDNPNEDMHTYPRKFVCRETKLVGTQMSKDATVKYIDGDLLLLTRQERMIKEIIT